MIRWTTPTFTIRLKESADIDLTEADNMYFTVANKMVTITKSGDDLEVEPKTVKVFLSQEDTGRLIEGEAEIQLNWTYTDLISGKVRRAATKPKKIRIDKNLLGEVVE